VSGSNGEGRCAEEKGASAQEREKEAASRKGGWRNVTGFMQSQLVRGDRKAKKTEGGQDNVRRANDD